MMNSKSKMILISKLLEISLPSLKQIKPFLKKIWGFKMMSQGTNQITNRTTNWILTQKFQTGLSHFYSQYTIFAVFLTAIKAT